VITRRSLAFAAVGLLLGAFVTLTVAAFFPNILDKIFGGEDEDRPPIIVKNGSLIFQSGKPPDDGKPWYEAAPSVWMQVHEKGKPITSYQVVFTGGSGDCSTKFAPMFTVWFDPDGEEGNAEEISYTVSRRPRTAHGTDAPSIQGSQTLKVDNAAQDPQLVYGEPGKGRISKVEGPGASWSCAKPSEVQATPLK